MSPTAKTMPIDVAVDREKKFLEQVREMIQSAVRDATTEALAQMNQVHRSHLKLVDRVNSFGGQLGIMVTDFNRFASWATNRGLREDMLDRRLERIEQRLEQALSIVTPELPKPDPTPPSTPE